MNARIFAAALALCMLLPASAAAQVDLDLRVSPQVGLLTPNDWFFYEVTGLGQGPMVWTESAVLRSTMLGLTAEVEIAETGVWIRGNVLRTVDGETYLAHAQLIQAFPGAPEVIRTEYYLPTTITLGSVEVALPTRFTLPLGIQPYFTVGIGGKRYGFDQSVLAEAPGGVVQPEDGTSFTANVGGGLIAYYRGIGLDLQVRDAISSYWDDQQHDVVWSAGLTWGIF